MVNNNNASCPHLPLAHATHYKAFHPDGIAGLTRLIELLVYLRQGPISLRSLIDILYDINEGIETVDFSTFIHKNCPNISIIVIDGLIKCKFKNR